MKKALIQIGALTIVIATISGAMHFANSHSHKKQTPIWADSMGMTAADDYKAAYPFGPKPAAPSAAWYQDYNACIRAMSGNSWSQDYLNRVCIADANSRVGS
jgi:hypothetical protein